MKGKKQTESSHLLAVGNSPPGAVSTMPCVACKQEIPSGASVCSICKSYQHLWKNHIQYAAGIVTLFVLIASGSIWLYEKARTTFWYHDDVRLISCNSLGSAVVLNRGDGEVFISHLLLYMPGRSADWEAKQLDFRQSLPAGRFVSREFPQSRIPGKAEFIRGLGTADFERLLSRAANSDSCLELAFFAESDQFLRDLKQMAGPTLNTFPVAGYLEYWGVSRDSTISLPIIGTGVLRRDSRPECQQGG